MLDGSDLDGVLMLLGGSEFGGSEFGGSEFGGSGLGAVVCRIGNAILLKGYIPVTLKLCMTLRMVMALYQTSANTLLKS